MSGLLPEPAAPITPPGQEDKERKWNLLCQLMVGCMDTVPSYPYGDPGQKKEILMAIYKCEIAADLLLEKYPK